jgi:hypothetical protein
MNERFPGRSSVINLSLLSLLFFYIVFCFHSPVSAEVPLSEAIDKMARSGRWFPVVKEDENHTWYSDPYSIIKISDQLYQVNVARFDQNMRYDPPDIMNNTFVYTAEIDCRKMKFRPAGWRYEGIFRKNKVLINSYIKYNNKSIIYFISAQVCGVKSAEKDIILIANINVNTGFYAENNLYYSNSLDENIRYILNPVSNEKAYIYCKERIGIIKGSTDFQAEAVIGSPLGVVYDWVCRGIHPDTRRVTLPFDAPAIKLTTAAASTQAPPPVDAEASSGKGGATRKRSSNEISDAKRKCAALGFRLGTSKFGKCVLQITK